MVAKRTMLCFGWNYVTTSRSLTPAPEMPTILLALRNRCATAAAVVPEAFKQVIVSRYPEGAGIGAHIDAPVFGEPVVGVSLLGSARMKFQREGHEPDVVTLAPRSLYVMSGEARWHWKHAIVPVKDLRYSITFRTLGEPRKGTS